MLANVVGKHGRPKYSVNFRRYAPAVWVTVYYMIKPRHNERDVSQGKNSRGSSKGTVQNQPYSGFCACKYQLQPLRTPVNQCNSRGVRPCVSYSPGRLDRQSVPKRSISQLYPMWHGFRVKRQVLISLTFHCRQLCTCLVVWSGLDTSYITTCYVPRNILLPGAPPVDSDVHCLNLILHYEKMGDSHLGVLRVL